MYGALAGELVLDKSRMPLKIQPVSVPTISFKPDGKGLKPMQTVGQDEIDLDVPTFIMIALDQDLLDPYSSSPLESAIKPVVFQGRLCAGHPPDHQAGRSPEAEGQD